MEVLVIEDEARLREMIRVYLSANGMSVTDAEHGNAALEILKDRSFDVIVLDLMMPEMDGYSFLQSGALRTPVLVLSAKTQTEDKLRGFELGIGDYLTKPFDMRELVARLRALAGRRAEERSQNEEVPEFHLQYDAHRLLVCGRPVPLTPKEFEIIERMCRRPERVFTRDDLLFGIWGDEFEGDVRVVDTHVKNIRDKCKRAGLSYNPITTVWGVGYRFGGGRE